MLPLAIYMLKVMLISGILFGYYTLALRNERFHEWNRYYLIMSVVIAIVLPFVRWSALFSGDAEPVYVHRLKTFTLSAHEAVTTGATQSNGWMWWSAVMYALIALILIMGVIAGIRRVYRRIREGEKERFPFFTLVRNRLNESPFSFFHFIFWNNQITLSSEEGGQILRHELVHVHQQHSIDKLFMEVILAIFWINPFFYLIRKELHIIHEFIADRSSCQGQHTGNRAGALVSPQQYATLLVKQALRTNNIAFANHFFQKQLTRRVHMLIRDNKARFTWLKRVMAIPLALVVMSFFLFLQSEARDNNIPLLTHMHRAIEKTVARPGPLLGKWWNQTLKSGLLKNNDPEAHDNTIVSPSPPKEFPLSATESPLSNENNPTDHSTEAGARPGKVYTFVKQMPSFPGGEQSLMAYLHDHIHYPQVARENGIQGTIVVQFIVNTDGSLGNITTIGTKKGGGLEEEAIRVVKGMPDWIAGKQQGRSVAVQYSLPIRFEMSNGDPVTHTAQPAPPPPPSKQPAVNGGKHAKIFSFVEKMPSFPGGQMALMKYIHDHVHYPAVAREDGIQGTVVVQFIVHTDGSLSDITTVGQMKGGGLEQEAEKVVRSMPNWTPGLQDGRKMTVKYTLPIRFVLQ